MNHKYTVHIDIDSPITLANFYNVQLLNYTSENLEKFYKVTFDRMLNLFEKFNIRATFFCVASEIENSKIISDIIKKAIEKGHFIGHHTYSHPFGLNELNNDEIKIEIEKANNIFLSNIGIKPIGFRSPGYAIDNNLINILEEKGLKYDSSAGWPIFHIIFKFLRKIGSKKMKVGYGETNAYLRPIDYIPNQKNWQQISKIDRDFREYPLPSSFYFLPCYSNLHLTFPFWFTKILLHFTKRNNLLIYLMHAIEFSSINDDFIPKEISVHPHVNKDLIIKLNKLEKILSYINSKRKYYSIEENE